MAADVRTSLPADKAAHRGVLLLFAGLLVTMLLASLNLTVMSAALPTIVGELHGTDQMYWVITSYILASTVVMPIYGKLGDLYGRKPLLIIAICIFTAGSALGAVSPNMLCLIIARTVQGLGAGGLIILPRPRSPTSCRRANEDDTPASWVQCSPSRRLPDHCWEAHSPRGRDGGGCSG